MVVAAGHGGGCCGARHLRAFTFAEENNPDLINQVLATLPDDRMVEVILNGTQVRQYPNILQRLADLGFVYDSHWINGNHNSSNHRFTRCDNRRPLNAPYPGMIGVPIDMRGELQQKNSQVARADGIRRTLHCHYAWRNGAGPYLPIHIGDRVRVNSPTSLFNGYEAVVRGRDIEDRISLRADNGETFRITRTNLVFLGRADGAAEPAAVVNRHEVAQEGAAPVAQARRERTVVASLYHNVFRTRGRSNAGWETLEQARAASPRAIRVERKDIFSDGTVTYTAVA